jgi:cholesterol transport system auxiliary component
MRWLPLLLLPLLTACGAISSLSEASRELDAYTLSPLPPEGTPAPGRRHLVVEAPGAPGALATDRILVKPQPFQAQYLADARWTEPAPELLQTLLVASFQNRGGFRLVERTGAGLMPDYTLMTELQAFQAEPQPDGTVTLTVAAVLTLIREADRSILATRRVAASQAVASDDTALIVAGLDRTLQSVLAETVAWTRDQAR